MSGSVMGESAGQQAAPASAITGSERALSDAYAQLRPSAYGVFLLALCIVVGMVEGYDVQAMSLAAPLLAREWGLTPQAVGSLLSASLIGQVFGGFLLAPLGDKLGRRHAMLLGLAIAGLATLAGAYVPGYGSMIAARFVAGLGLGLALANTIALAMELVPGSWRTMAVVLVCSGYPLGAACGAAAVGQLLPTMGVAAVFYVGAVSTLIAWAVCIVALPESPVMMVRQSSDQTRLRALFGRLGVAIDPAVKLVGDASGAAKSRLAELFTPERRNTTLLLWLLNFANLSLVYFFVMWTPSLFVSSGLDPRAAIRATSLFSFSGILGGLTFAALLPRIGPVATLGFCYAATIVSVGIFAGMAAPATGFYVALAACGFLIIGSQFCLSAVVNLFYPGPIRATGSGMALSAGRVGGVFAPIVGGFILSHVASPQQAFYIALVPAAISLLTLLALRRLRLVGLRSE
ncbi:MFS transporter [Sphingomonas sp. AOB5]|uniref:MFS transporter n=1 Tax=Sphingomonas sp. AOB5 TaxID=3034017 RepID=UPI0023F6B667|nr:MFS transporter [Sphingomonas sp. AOB5]MDF7777847.1 MFS transporter [Sphingomonas sp. AOB5]